MASRCLLLLILATLLPPGVLAAPAPHDVEFEARQRLDRQRSVRSKFAVQAPQPVDEATLDPYPGKKRVTFRADRTFKLTVFSDLHFGENEEGPWGPEQDFSSIRRMRAILSDEKPDYVYVILLRLENVHTADVLQRSKWGPDNWRECVAIPIFRAFAYPAPLDTFRENSTAYIDEIVKPLNEAKVPFSSSHGVRDATHVKIPPDVSSLFLEPRQSSQCHPCRRDRSRAESCAVELHPNESSWNWRRWRAGELLGACKSLILRLSPHTQSPSDLSK